MADYTLPDLPYDYGVLDHTSAQIGSRLRRIAGSLLTKKSQVSSGPATRERRPGYRAGGHCVDK